MADPVTEFVARLQGVKRLGDGWVARCPAHDDREPSLKVDRGDDGRVLLRCHAGCKTPDIVRAVGLEMRDLMPTEVFPSPAPRLQIVGNTARKPAPEPSRPPKHQWPEVARYDYTDEDGVLLFSVVRREYEGAKTFTQVQPDGTLGLKGISARPLYRLPLVRQAVASGDVVLLVEGEKDVDTAEALGYVATTNCGGANSWQPDHAAVFTNANVVVVPDADAAGHQWAEAVCASLLGVAAQVRVVSLPGVPEKGDLTDWVNAGGSAEALGGLILRAPTYHGGALPVVDRTPSRFTVYSVDELANLPPMRWLVDDMVPADALVAMVGPSGVGKTFVGLDLACSIAVGTPWLGHGIGTAAPVLYIAAEGTAGLRARVMAWAMAHGTRTASLPVWFICETVNLMDPDDPAHVIRAMTRLPVPPGCVVIDTLHRAMPGGDENSAKDVGVVVAAADRIRRTAGCTVVLVHHTKKDADVERGSTALRAACDTLLLLKDEDGTLSLECEKQKDAASFAPIPVHLTPAHGSLVARRWTGTNGGDRVADPAGLTKNELKALHALEECALPDGLTALQWQEVSGVTKATFYRVAKRLCAAGLAQQSGRGGRYSVTVTGLAVVRTVSRHGTNGETTGTNGETSVRLGETPPEKTAGGERGGETPLKGGRTPPLLSPSPSRRETASETGRPRETRGMGRRGAGAPASPPAWVLEGPQDEAPDPWWVR